MARKNRYQPPNKRPARRTGPSGAPALPRVASPAVKQPATVYGKPFVLLEDESKGTFIFKNGAWIAHSMSIAECRQSCLVTELAQKVNRMTRYEVRCPIGMEE